MKIKQVIETLREKGFNVSFYKRKDGGIRITRINGQTFRGSEGNTEARKIVGTDLSELQKRALSKLTTPKGKGTYNLRRKEKIDKEAIKEIQRLQRKYRASGKKEGKPTIRNYRYVMKEKGREEANRLLKQSARRILGLAYVENVQALIDRLSLDMSKIKEDRELVADVIKRLESMKETLKERILGLIVDIDGPLYQWEQRRISTSEFKRQIDNLLDKN